MREETILFLSALKKLDWEKTRNKIEKKYRMRPNKNKSYSCKRKIIIKRKISVKKTGSNGYN